MSVHNPDDFVDYRRLWESELTTSNSISDCNNRLDDLELQIRELTIKFGRAILELNKALETKNVA